MNLSPLLALIAQAPGYAELKSTLQSEKESALRRGRPLGLLRAARPALLAALAQDLSRPLLVVVATAERSRALTESLRAWMADPTRLHRFPEPNALFYERAPWTQEVVVGRLQTLAALLEPGDRPPIVVTSVRALMQVTLPPRQFRLGTRTLRQGQLTSMEKLVAAWLGLGYRPATVVEVPGQFSRRGGILDVYPPTDEGPVRIEFFGDEVESLRRFDPATQRSRERLERITIPPASEALPRLGPAIAPKLTPWDLSRLPKDEAEPLRRDRQRLAEGSFFPELPFYLPYLYAPTPSWLLDYLPPEGLIVVEEPEALRDAWADLEQQAHRLREEATRQGRLPPGYPPPYLPWERWQEALTRRPWLNLGYGEEEETHPHPLSNAFIPGPRFGGQIKPLLGHLRSAQAVGEPVILISRQAPRLAELWTQETGQDAPLQDALPIADGLLPPLTFVQGVLEEGWSLRTERRGGAPARTIHLFTDAELFGWRRPAPRRRPRPRPIAPESPFTDLEPGDYVVHIEHGIGIFRGLTTLHSNGSEREYLVIQYAGEDRLYVPIHQADRVSRYIGTEDRPPRLHRLGTAEWDRVKRQAKQAVEQVARELLELYAARELVPGHAFSPDTDWQHELEAAFPYIETEDQIQAIEAVKRDMERPRPMDRLICGDAGYGKTEVALRAAFKAVMDGKQVAFLVPTTVLAQQHYNTFRERLAPFPVEVEMLSRFRSPREQREILERLEAGQVDIVIGTHRLLSPDVRFKDLGLLIIDEEQRFGVTHKERLKRMRTQVDVLTMTATPIPRTLYMALTGVREISTIETPPEERLPVTIHVGEYDPNVVRHAILRELERGGQVFYVHNRVQTIATVKRRLERLVPEARIAIAHGQMREADLERVMLRFVDGEVDLLLTTTIIESGLDIPNANTIIVEDADRFGLAQLYQLRGRVGRGAMRAYAYFFYRRGRMTEEARQRLETIRETGGRLGAGFNIAMRDLEIRGAGELLGVRQHGHIAAVGFDLYTRLLAQAVQELKARRGETLRERERGMPTLPPLVTIDLPLPAYIPEAYVSDQTLRLRLYRRLAQVARLEEVEAMAEELADRFGPRPQEVENLLFQLRIKVLAGRAGVRAIRLEAGKLAVYCDRLAEVNRPGLQRRLGHGIRVGRRAIWIPWLSRERAWAGKSAISWQELLVRVLETLATER